MAESVSQQDFFGDQSMHYMTLQAIMSKTSEDIFHDSHLQLQERMRNPITFHTEIMGDIMYLQQMLRQPDAKEFVQAAIKKSMDTWIPTTGHRKKDAKSLRMSK
jgi:hypothetical protein